MNNILIETINLKKSFNHLKNSITLFNNFEGCVIFDDLGAVDTDLSCDDLEHIDEILQAAPDVHG